ncbi:hypothetical protein BDQ17DRAFT_1433687 [Cyathus striatus]|nr:hypothetical protein BDQ17DRAFT_1433687 [Cyathus striatus]
MKLPVTNAIFRLISSSPQIRRINLTSISLPSFMDGSTWSRLTVVSLNIYCDVTPNDVIQCLSMGTSAKEITFCHSHVLSDPDTSNKVASLPHLSLLKLSIRANVAKILQYISLPRLKQLDIDNYGQSFDSEALTRFYTQSKCYISDLHIYFEGDTADGLQNDNIGQFLSVPWVEDVHNVIINGYRLAEDAQLTVLRNPDVSSKVKDKLTHDDGLLGWGRFGDMILRSMY